MHWHHIVPKHQGGSGDASNLVLLSVEEHAEAHKKLYEQFGFEEDLIAWRGLAGLISTEEAVREAQRLGGKKAIAIKNPWSGKKTSTNWLMNSENQKKATEAAASKEAIKKRIQSFSIIGHQQGTKNSQSGTALYIMDGKFKRFKKNCQPKGWQDPNEVRESLKDKTSGCYGRSWFNNGRKNYFLFRDDPLVTEMKLERRKMKL